MRKDIAERRDELMVWIAQGVSKAAICRELRCRQSTLNGWLRRMGIAYAGNQCHNRGQRRIDRMAAETLAARAYVTPFKLKVRLLEDGIFEPRCQRCQRTTWLRRPIPLELHHRDGDRWNNALANLELLCPNCHALTPNHAGRAVGRYS
jgi:5-methylcytosine-specific restriction endonuclease McrA